MLGTLIKDQALENIYGIKFVVTFIVCTVLMIGATIVSIGRYETQLRDEKHIVSTNLGSLAEAEDWRDAGEEGVKVVKPTNKLGMFASGLEDSVGRTATVKEGDFPHMEDSIYSTAPIFAVFGEIDLTFIIKIVISLFAILFTYDLVSGEKERGTLKQCLSNPVPRNTYILGKSIGSFISLLIPLVIPLLISLLIIIAAGGVAFGEAEWTGLGVIILSYVLYMLAFFCLGIFVSTLTRHSAVSFLVLLFVWVLLVLVVPKGSMMLADQLYPIPSINDVRADLFANDQNFSKEVWQQTAVELANTGATKLQGRERHMKFRETRHSIREELEPKFKAQNERIVDDFKREQSNLTNLAMNFSRISPASAVTYVGMNIAGTGYQEQERFLSQLTMYRETFDKFVEAEHEKEHEAQRQQFRRGGDWLQARLSAAEEEGKLDVSTIPKFEYRSLDFGERLMMVLPDLAALMIISIIFYLLAFINFLRYDVR